MAESYRGLTVHIGADTTSLQKAMKGINSAVSATQGQLTRLQRALSGLGDDVSASASAKQLELLSNAAQETATKLATLKRSYAEVASQSFRAGDIAGTMAEVSQQIGDANARAGQLGDQIRGVLAELTRTYDLIAANKDTEGIRLDDDRIAAEKNLQAINDALKATGKSVKEFGKNANADEVADEFARVGLITEETAQHIHNLRGNYNDLQQEMKQVKQVQMFQDDEVEIEKVDAQLSKVLNKLRELKSQSSIARGLDGESEELRLLSTAADAAADRFRELDRAAKIDPKNVEVTEARTKALAEAQSLAAEKAKALKERIEAYNSAGIDKAASNTEHVGLNLEKAQAKAKQFGDALQEAEGRAQSIADEMSVIEAKDDGLGANAKQAAERYKQLEAELEKVNAEISELRVKADSAMDELDTAKACAELEQLESEMIQAKAASEGLGNSTKSAFGDGVSVIIDISQYARQAASAITRAADEIDTAYRDMRKTVDGTETQFEHLRDAALEYSQTHFTSADTILEMEAMGGQLGIATDKLEQFATTASNLDIATNIDADAIAQQMGQLANIMDDLNPDNLDKYADALVRLGNNTPALESDISEITTRIASQANIVGMTTPQVLAWSAALASTGQKSEAAGTALSKTMSQIEAAVGGGTSAIADLAEATDMSVDEVLRIVAEGGPAFQDLADAAGTSTDEIAAAMDEGKGKLEDFAAVAGMSADKFAALWKSSPSDALKAFIEGLKAVKDAGGSMDNTLANLGITAVRQKQGIEGLTQTTDTLNSALQMSGDAWNGVADQWGDAGDAAREADKKSEGFSGSLQKLSNNAQVLAANFGQGLMPLMDTATGIIGALADAFKTMPSSVSTTVSSLGALATGVSMLYPVVRGLRHSWGELTDAITGTKIGQEAVNNLKKLVEPLTAITGLSGGAIGAIAAGLATLGAIAIDEAGKQQQFNDTLRELPDIARNASATIDNATGSLEAAGDAALMSTDDVRGFVSALGESADKTQENLAKAGTSADMLGKARDVIKEFAGQAGLNAEQQGKLKVALDTVNGALGTSITQSDVAAGSYTDQNGAVQNLVGSLDQLIAKKQAEIKVNALSEGATQAYKDKIEAERKHAEQMLELSKKRMEVKDLEAQRDAQYNAGLGAEANDTQTKIDDLNTEIADGERALKGLKESVDATTSAYNYYASALGEAQVVANGARNEMEALLVTSDEGKFRALGDAIRSNNQDVVQFADQLNALGVTTQQMGDLQDSELMELAAAYDGSTQSIYDTLTRLRSGWDLVDVGAAEAKLKLDAFVLGFQQLDGGTQDAFNGLYGGIENLISALGDAGISIDTLNEKHIDPGMLATWAIEAGGDIDVVKQKIKDYNQTPVDDKTANVDTGDATTKVDDLGGKLVEFGLKPFVAKVTASGTDQLATLTGKMSDFSKHPSVEKTAKVDAQGQGPLDDLRGAYDEFSKLDNTEKTATANANGEWGVRGLTDAANDFDSLPNNVTKTRTLETYNVTKNAAGGVRLHAEGGYIATGPTYMTPRDLVGEAGAEAIVPLTNRRYTGAFARVIAEEIAKGGGDGGSVVANFYVTAASDPEAFARQSMRAVVRLARSEG